MTAGLARSGRYNENMSWRLPNKPDAETAKRIVCALIAEAGGRFEGKTRLNKAFWWAHVHYYKHHRGLLSQYPIARLPEGPAIDDADDLLVSLEREGRIELAQEPVPNQPEPQAVYILKQQPTTLGDDALDSIHAASEWIRGRYGTAASEESHRLSRGWQNGRNGDVIDIALDALTPDDYQATKEEIEKIDKCLDRARALADKVFQARPAKGRV